MIAEASRTYKTGADLSFSCSLVVSTRLAPQIVFQFIAWIFFILDIIIDCFADFSKFNMSTVLFIAYPVSYFSMPLLIPYYGQTNGNICFYGYSLTNFRTLIYSFIPFNGGHNDNIAFHSHNLISRSPAQPPQTRTGHLGEDEIRQLRIISVPTAVVNERRCCSICLDDFKVDQRVLELRCSHYHHVSCITEWLSRASTCPDCRSIQGHCYRETTWLILSPVYVFHFLSGLWIPFFCIDCGIRLQLKQLFFVWYFLNRSLWIEYK